jgi:hypothetical protein
MSTPNLASLVERLARPRRIGFFGHRGVGKTTLLTMLYRESISGRLPGLRLAAADERTAKYLAEKILEIESGQAAKPTLEPTELRFHLFNAGAKIELVLLDYQGDLPEGSDEGVEASQHGERNRPFLRDCDAVFLCLDASRLSSLNAKPSPEQEVAALVAAYRAVQEPDLPPRPMALVVTKAEYIVDAGSLVAIRSLLEQALEHSGQDFAERCKWHGVFAVSSMGRRNVSGTLSPQGLEPALQWLVHAMTAQDLLRFDVVHQSKSASHIEQAARAICQNYPEVPKAQEALRAARSRRWSKRIRRVGIGIGMVLVVVFGAWAYDALGWTQFQRNLVANDDATTQRRLWDDYRFWYPTRFIFNAEALQREQEALARQAEKERSTPTLDPTKQDPKIAEALARLESLESLDEAMRLVDALANRDHPAETKEEIAKRRALIVQKIDRRNFAHAKEHSTKNPKSYAERLTKYQTYLEQHPTGDHAHEAREELAKVVKEWDRAEYQEIREAFFKNPSELDEHRKRGEAYLKSHTKGEFRPRISELLAWCDKVSQPNDYTLTLKSGSFSKANATFTNKPAAMFSWGPSLSVQLEVGGKSYGPSTIVKNTYTPTWDYEFPRKIRWKLGDEVRISVTDNYFWKRKVGDISFSTDPLAFAKLNGEVELKLGKLTFSSDFSLPNLPPVALPKAD